MYDKYLDQYLEEADFSLISDDYITSGIITTNTEGDKMVSVDREVLSLFKNDNLTDDEEDIVNDIINIFDSFKEQDNAYIGLNITIIHDIQQIKTDIIAQTEALMDEYFRP